MPVASFQIFSRLGFCAERLLQIPLTVREISIGDYTQIVVMIEAESFSVLSHSVWCLQITSQSFQTLLAI